MPCTPSSSLFSKTRPGRGWTHRQAHTSARTHMLSFFHTSSSHVSAAPQIFLHGNNLNSLHQLIQPECLPSEFGGTLPPYDMGMWARTLLGPDYNDETEYMLTYAALHVRENCGGGGDVMKRWPSIYHNREEAEKGKNECEVGVHRDIERKKLMMFLSFRSQSAVDSGTLRQTERDTSTALLALDWTHTFERTCAHTHWQHPNLKYKMNWNVTPTAAKDLLLSLQQGAQKTKTEIWLVHVWTHIDW